MEFKVVPSLMQITSVKIALLLIQDDKDIGSLLDRDVMIPYQFDFFDRGRHKLWQIIEMVVIKKFSILPPSVATKLVRVLQPMHFQAIIWLRDHDLMPHRKGFSINYRKSLCWKIDGTIDRIETARQYVEVEGIDTRDRFIMACNYLLRDAILHLWDIVKIVGIHSTSRRGVNSAVRLWMDLLRRGCTNPTNEMIEEYFRIEHLTETDIPLRLSPYFRYLSPACRKDYFKSLASSQLHEDDFRLCLCELDEEERKLLFRTIPAEALSRYLEWPFHTLFIDKAEEMSWYLVLSDYRYILNYILKLFLLSGDIYSEIFKEYWCAIPILYKVGIKRDEKKFPAFDIIINYKKNQNRALEELVAEQYFTYVQ